MVSVNNSSLFSQIGIPCFYSVVSVQAKLISSEPSSEMRTQMVKQRINSEV